MNVSMIAHDMRTPLHALLLGVHAAGALAGTDEELRAILENAEKNGWLLARMLDDLMNLGGISATTYPLVFRECRVENLVANAVECVAQMAATKNQRILTDPVPLSVVADGDRLLRVLTNLLNNALKFSAPGSSIFIQIKPRSNDGHKCLIFSVLDEGPGIAEEDIDRVFLHGVSITSSFRSSSGLGLAICRELVEAHGGHIWVEQGRQSGCCISFSIPRNLTVDPAPPENIDKNGISGIRHSVSAQQKDA